MHPNPSQINSLDIAVLSNTPPAPLPHHHHNQPSNSALTMTASQQTTYLNAIHGTSTILTPTTNANQPGTSANTMGSTTASGHGPHPSDHPPNAHPILPTRRVGPPQAELEGEQMADPGEGRVMDAQLQKKGGGWGEEDSLTEGLERKKREQEGERGRCEEERRRGGM
ncbi:hypothetical protein VC83_04294 [Pseudogymnoascus destructans]|uniref:Uncharacterized protein n=1 Tax=Pseudogymnoascus destructans TaxID=655981 RepID=A0A177AD03_9PEZI|nr:uncharacterized protein VC83_04294 [Pseudogymnoascus destructans]OAF59054.2 hypothetical protein VC83_04294 [Pseudogymnoascus destructans]